MKRFFKKASLLLVVLCLIAGSALPAFAQSRALQTVDGVYTFYDDRLLATGNGSEQYNTYMYYCFTGTWDPMNVHNGSLIVAADCRGGPMASHRTQFYMDLEAVDEQGNCYYYEEIDKDSRYDGTYIFDGRFEEDYYTIYSPATSYVIFDFIATNGGDSWNDMNIGHFTPGQEGWEIEY